MPDDDAKYEAKGTPLEKGMIKFLMHYDIKANEHGGYGHGDDCPNMLKYVNDVRPKFKCYLLINNLKEKSSSENCLILN